MAKRGRPPYPDVLTPREWEVLSLLRGGLSNEAISSRLGISLDGVKYHVSEILGKLGLENRHDAARWRPDDERRWWAIAPLGLWRRLDFGWLGTAAACALLLLVAGAIGLLVWALMATGDGDGGSAGAVGLPAGDRLAYVGTDTNLWLLEDSGPARRITEGGNYSLPTWSPDGRQLFFILGSTSSLMSLWSYDVDSREIGQAPPGPLGFFQEWSPDGERFVYNDHGAIWISDADGNAREIIADGFGAFDIAWSPDGKHLAVSRLLPVQHPDDWNAPGAQVKIPPENGIYLIDVDDGEPEPVVLVDAIQRAWDRAIGVQRSPTAQPVAEAGVAGATVLTEDPEQVPGWDAERSPVSARSDAWPSLSPDGRRIVFQASEFRPDIALGLDIGKVEGPKEGIWIVNADGSDPRQLTSDPDQLDFFPQWSADGESVLFVRTDGRPFAGDFAGEGSVSAELWVMRADGSGARPLISDLQRIGSYYGLFSWEQTVAWYQAGS